MDKSLPEINMFVSPRELLQINVIFLTGLFILVGVAPEMSFFKIDSFIISVVFLCLSSFFLLAAGQSRIDVVLKLSDEKRIKFQMRIHNICIFFTAFAFFSTPLFIFSGDII